MKSRTRASFKRSCSSSTTCEIPILITPAIQASLGLAIGWRVLILVGMIALVMTATLTWLLMSMSTPTPKAALR